MCCLTLSSTKVWFIPCIFVYIYVVTTTYCVRVELSVTAKNSANFWPGQFTTYHHHHHRLVNWESCFHLWVGGGAGDGSAGGGGGGDHHHPQMKTYSIAISPCKSCIITHVILEMGQQGSSCYCSKIHQNLYATLALLNDETLQICGQVNSLHTTTTTTHVTICNSALLILANDLTIYIGHTASIKLTDSLLMCFLEYHLIILGDLV